MVDWAFEAGRPAYTLSVTRGEAEYLDSSSFFAFRFIRELWGVPGGGEGSFAPPPLHPNLHRQA